MRQKMLLPILLYGIASTHAFGPKEECDWTVSNLIMESSSRALLHYCLATSPASEELLSEDQIKTPVAVIEKFCHSTGAIFLLFLSV